MELGNYSQRTLQDDAVVPDEAGLVQEVNAPVVKQVAAAITRVKTPGEGHCRIYELHVRGIPMNLHQLCIFCSVVEQGSYTKAAEVL